MPQAASTSSARVNSEASPSIASSSSVSYASGASREERRAVREVHVHAAHVEAELGHLGREAQQDALVGLDAQREQVRLRVGVALSPKSISGGSLNWIAISVARRASRLPVRR